MARPARRFLFRLALGLGVLDVDELADRLPSRLFSEWMAYERLEPWGELRADLRAGIIASTFANIHRNSKKRSKPFTPQDFMPYVERRPSADSVALSRRLRAAFQGFRA